MFEVRQLWRSEGIRLNAPATPTSWRNTSSIWQRTKYRVVPFVDEQEVKLSRVLTDRGTEYCGNPEHHEYELYLGVEDIDHSRTKTKSPQTNGIAEHFRKTVLNEFYRIAFRKKLYASIGELQDDLDLWIKSYNEERPHQGRWCFGKTPMAGLNVVLLSGFDGNLWADTKIDCGFFFDAAADDDQRDALVKIFTGQVGGWMSQFVPAHVKGVTGIEFAKIELEIEDNLARLIHRGLDFGRADVA